MTTTPATLHAVEQGAGDVVLALHSGGMSSRQYKKLIDKLATTNRVIAPDFLGSGANAPWPADAPFDLNDDVDAVQALLSARAIDTFHVVGHSYGGLVALKLAARDPKRVRSIALFEPVAFGVVDVREAFQAAAPLATADDGGSPRWFEEFVDYWGGAGAWRALSEGARAAFLRAGRKVFLEVKGLVADRTPVSAYAALTMPVLVLVGENTQPAERVVCATLAEGLPNGVLGVVSGAGHMGPLTHADDVNARIAEHIARAR